MSGRDVHPNHKIIPNNFIHYSIIKLEKVYKNQRRKACKDYRVKYSWLLDFKKGSTIITLVFLSLQTKKKQDSNIFFYASFLHNHIMYNDLFVIIDFLYSCKVNLSNFI